MPGSHRSGPFRSPRVLSRVKLLGSHRCKCPFSLQTVCTLLGSGIPATHSSFQVTRCHASHLPATPGIQNSRGIMFHQIRRECGLKFVGFPVVAVASFHLFLIFWAFQCFRSTDSSSLSEVQEKSSDFSHVLEAPGGGLFQGRRLKCAYDTRRTWAFHRGFAYPRGVPAGWAVCHRACQAPAGWPWLWYTQPAQSEGLPGGPPSQR